MSRLQLPRPYFWAAYRRYQINWSALAGAFAGLKIEVFAKYIIDHKQTSWWLEYNGSDSNITVVLDESHHRYHVTVTHDDVIKYTYFTLYWPFVRGIHRWPVDSPHKDQWRGALMFSLICALKMVQQTIKTAVILDAMALIMTSLQFKQFTWLGKSATRNCLCYLRFSRR